MRVYRGRKETWRPEDKKQRVSGRQYQLSLVLSEGKLEALVFTGSPSMLELARRLAAANCSSDTLTSPPHTVSKRATVLIGLNCVRDGRGN